MRNPAQKPTPPGARGFTLIELLVVIPIIAVLLGILLPALRSARRSAVDQQCRARLASIGSMYGLYGAEHHGAWPTFEYPRRVTGEPDALRIPAWGASGGWLILPINEMTFWGYALRDYATDNSNAEILRAVEALSCPVVFDRWFNALPPDQQSGDATIMDPMSSPQNSYFHSLALFTAPSGWADDAPIHVNEQHARVALSDVAHPSQKAALVEKASHHDQREARIESAGPQQFNILAADGHVERRSADAAAEPAGFIARYTGLEIPRQHSDQYAHEGIRYVSTAHGALGRDW